MMRIIPILLVLFSLPFSFIAQDKGYVMRMIDSLCAPHYHGRGYVEQGDVKAAEFILEQCKEIGLKPVNGSYLQSFSFGVNTFPGAMDVTVNNAILKTGEDFIIEPRSIGQKGDFKAFTLKNRHTKSAENLYKLSEKSKVNESIVIIDATKPSLGQEAFLASLYENPLRSKGYIVLTDNKLTWSVGRSMLPTTIITAKKEALPKRIKNVDLSIDQQWVEDYESQNVMALIPGTKSEKTLVFTAHYDHLGRMGADTYIAGASDNASGSAMLLDLAKYYQENPPEYTTLFIWFAGEEAGLLGSKYFVDNSPIDLSNIKFLLNLDLMADAKKGITVVNGKEFPDAFNSLQNINEELKLLDLVKPRGSSSNSDHYPFYKKGVPSFFIYTVGDYQHYHDVFDIPENIPLTNYNEVFKLITSFVERNF
ncbi:MAG: M28 family peptidase [Salibacteraceae bacterium]